MPVKKSTTDLTMAIPRHVAIIMDGNGRWAEQRGKFRTLGHKEGVKSVRCAVNYAVKQGIQALTLYAFSSENWNRPMQEVSALMDLFMLVLDREIKTLHNNNIRLRIIGDRSRFNSKLQNKILKSEELTKNNTGLSLNIAANYGSRWDITQAAKALAIKVQQGVLSPEDFNEQLISEHVCLSDLPSVDLLIRTGGEHRISNFLLWQIAYAEFYFSEVLWPDFNAAIFENALEAFSQRERRFGGTESLATESV